jgi:hypothetical protein
VLEAGSSTKFLTNSANPTLWTLFGVTQGIWGRVNYHPEKGLMESKVVPLNQLQCIIIIQISPLKIQKYWGLNHVQFE